MFENWIVKYTDLHYISLRGNKIIDDGILSVICTLSGLPGLKLKTLDLRNNLLSPEGLKMIHDAGIGNQITVNVIV
jgi:hypothetical protein